MKMEHTDCSETSAYKIQTTGNYPEENIQLTRCNRVVEFIIPMFLNCSTCFGRHTAHHQELKNCNCSLWFYIRLWLNSILGGTKRNTTNKRYIQASGRLLARETGQWMMALLLVFISLFTILVNIINFQTAPKSFWYTLYNTNKEIYNISGDEWENSACPHINNIRRQLIS